MGWTMVANIITSIGVILVIKKPVFSDFKFWLIIVTPSCVLGFPEFVLGR
jgi:hypothetical protein